MNGRQAGNFRNGAADRKLKRAAKRQAKKDRKAKKRRMAAQHLDQSQQEQSVRGGKGKTMREKYLEDGLKTVERENVKGKIIPDFGNDAAAEGADPEDQELEYLSRKLGLNKGKGDAWGRLGKEFEEDGFHPDVAGFVQSLVKEGSAALSRETYAGGGQDSDFSSQDHSAHARVQVQLQPDFGDDGAAEDPEDQELEYLSRKLGLNKGDAWGRLEKEFAEDGFHPEVADFVQSLAQGNAFKDAGVSDDDGDSEEEEEEEGEEDASEDESNTENAVYIPKTDLYGKNTKAAAESDTVLAKTPEMTAVRSRPRFFGSLSVQDRLKRRVKGLLNRITEENANPVCRDISALYETSSSRRDVNDGIIESVIGLCSVSTQTMPGLCRVLAAAVVGIDVIANRSTDLRPQFLEAVACAFAEKRSGNMALLMCNLYIFDVVSSGLIFDALLFLTQQVSNASEVETSVSLFSLILEQAGYKLRADDPKRLSDVVVAVRDLAKGASEGSRLDFMSTCIEDLKSNKQSLRAKHEAVMQRSNKLRKWLKHAQSVDGGSFVPLRISLDDLLHAKERGRWWIVGGVWSGRSPAAKMSSASSSGLRADSGGIRAGLALATPKLSKAAKKFRMNTDIKRAVFFSMMSAFTYEDAFANLLRLNLNDRQERTIVHVILDCVGRGKAFNPFFAHLGQRLCTYHHRFKFTFQLSFWDAFKKMEDAGPRHAANLASLFAHLVVNFSLSVATLKPLDFTRLGKMSTLFLLVSFERILLFDGEKLREGTDASTIRTGTMAVAKTFNRIAASKGGESVRDSISLFFHQHMVATKSAAPGDGSEIHAKTWRKRVKVVKKVLEAIEFNDFDGVSAVR